MAYSVESKKSGTTYYLHAKETESRGGRRKLHFFNNTFAKCSRRVANCDRMQRCPCWCRQPD